jgi:folate-binding protein YgfZ
VISSPFLALPQAVEAAGIDAQIAAHYGNPVAEQRAIVKGAIVDLSNRGVISVSGPDRLSWLNSLMSQSFLGLAPGESTEALLLGANGRLEFSAKVLDDGEATWLLLEAQELPGLLAWLLKMRFMLRVEVTDRSAEFATFGSLGTETPILDAFAAAPAGMPLVWRDPWAEISTGGVQYAAVDVHPGADFPWRETLVARSDVPALLERVQNGDAVVAGFLAAEALRIAAWRPRLATEADEKSIPHELDWMRSAVHLSKGCYRGQETVAKVHNLGHPPRRLVFLHLDGTDNVLPAPGDEVILPRTQDSEEDAVLGLVTSSANHYELGPIALAVIRRQAPVDAELAVRSDGTTVSAAQEVVVPPDAGSVVGRIRGLPRLGVKRR